MNQPDPLIYKKLGVRPRLADRFYVKDIVNFYQKQEAGLTDKEEQPLVKALSTFLEFVEHQRLEGWESCPIEFWKKLLAFSYLDLSYEQSLEQTKAFFETIVTFVKWLDQHYTNLNLATEVSALAQELEADVLEAVQFLDVYQQKIETPFLTGFEDVRRQTLLEEASGSPLSEGVFAAESQTDKGPNFYSLLNKGHYTVDLPSEIKGTLKEGTSVIGVLKETPLGQWEILVLDRVFPPAALPFVKQSIGIAE